MVILQLARTSGSRIISSSTLLHISLTLMTATSELTRLSFWVCSLSATCPLLQTPSRAQVQAVVIPCCMRPYVTNLIVFSPMTHWAWSLCLQSWNSTSATWSHGQVTYPCCMLAFNPAMFFVLCKHVILYWSCTLLCCNSIYTILHCMHHAMHNHANSALPSFLPVVWQSFLKVSSDLNFLVLPDIFWPWQATLTAGQL